MVNVGISCARAPGGVCVSKGTDRKNATVLSIRLTVRLSNRQICW